MTDSPEYNATNSMVMPVVVFLPRYWPVLHVYCDLYVHSTRVDPGHQGELPYSEYVRKCDMAVFYLVLVDYDGKEGKVLKIPPEKKNSDVAHFCSACFRLEKKSVGVRHDTSIIVYLWLCQLLSWLNPILNEVLRNIVYRCWSFPVQFKFILRF